MIPHNGDNIIRGSCKWNPEHEYGNAYSPVSLDESIEDVALAWVIESFPTSDWSTP